MHEYTVKKINGEMSFNSLYCTKKCKAFADLATLSDIIMYIIVGKPISRVVSW